VDFTLFLFDPEVWEEKGAKTSKARADIPIRIRRSIIQIQSKQSSLQSIIPIRARMSDLLFLPLFLIHFQKTH